MIGIGLSGLFWAVMEPQVYINMKSKTQLFLKIKIVEQQQVQLSDLIDAMPDSVIICTK